jgi:hypothetical protein
VPGSKIGGDLYEGDFLHVHHCSGNVEPYLPSLVLRVFIQVWVALEASQYLVKLALRKPKLYTSLFSTGSSEPTFNVSEVWENAFGVGKPFVGCGWGWRFDEA